jgi:tetratricopeptide (TPR) repeat protein
MKPTALLVVLASVACGSDDAQRHRTSTPGPSAGAADAGPVDAAIDAPPGPPTAALTEDLGRPYFAGEPAAAALVREDWAAAAVGFSALALTQTDPLQRGRALLLAGVAMAERKQWAQAADAFAGARALLPELADYLNYHEARSRYFARDGGAALARARAVDPASIVGADAELLVGDLLRGAGDQAAIAAHYGDYLARRPKGIRKSEARFRQAEALEASGATGPEAAALYRAITVDDPLSSWATKASARLTALAKAGPLPPLTAAERLTRAKALFDAMRNAESEAAYADALARPTPPRPIAASPRTTGPRACSRLAIARPRRRASTRRSRLCEAAGDKDLTIRAYYQAGRSLAFNGDHRTAIERYRAAAAVDPNHSYADDALLRSAEEYADLGDDAKVTATLEDLPTGSRPATCAPRPCGGSAGAPSEGRRRRPRDRLLAAADRRRADRRQLLGRGPAAVLDRPGRGPPRSARRRPGGLGGRGPHLPGHVLRDARAQPHPRGRPGALHRPAHAS